MSRALVTGGLGFVGSHLVDLLVQDFFYRERDDDGVVVFEETVDFPQCVVGDREEDLAIAKHHASNIDLGCGIADFLGE